MHAALRNLEMVRAKRRRAIERGGLSDRNGDRARHLGRPDVVKGFRSQGVRTDRRINPVEFVRCTQNVLTDLRRPVIELDSDDAAVRVAGTRLERN